MQTIIDTDIYAAAALLTEGEVVAIPTETVYGLAGNAYNPQAVAKIFEAKSRPYFDPLIVHTYNLLQVDEMVTHIPEPLLKLAQKFWPGPLTLLLQKKDTIPDLVTSGLPTVGIRIPNQVQTLKLLSKLKFPLAAPSANPFGYVSPTSADHVFKQLQGKIPYILDGGKCDIGLESTIVGMHDGAASIFRIGGLSVEEIEATIGKVKINIAGGDNPAAPGMLSSHYAPHKTIIVGNIAENIRKYASHKIGIISYREAYSIPDSKYCCILSVNGNMNEAAQNLFSAMRYLDNSEVDIILTEIVPMKGLGRAINDRLSRASYKRNKPLEK